VAAAQDAVWRAVCQTVFHVSDERFREWPQMTSWLQLYRLLEEWVPREGVYVCENVFPWGLLMVFKFAGGEFVGSVLFPPETAGAGAGAGGGGGGGGGDGGDDGGASKGAERVAVSASNQYQVYPVLRCTFDADGRATVSLCDVCAMPPTTPPFTVTLRRPRASEGEGAMGACNLWGERLFHPRPSDLIVRFKYKTTTTITTTTDGDSNDTAAEPHRQHVQAFRQEFLRVSGVCLHG
jgi:hypothetical protein